MIGIFFWLKHGHFDASRRAHPLANRKAKVDSTCFLGTFPAIEEIRAPLKKGCDLTVDPIQPYPRMVVRANDVVNYDQTFARDTVPQSGRLASVVREAHAAISLPTQ